MKAILILDEMPKTCGECPYSYYSDLEDWEDESKYCAIHKGGYLEDYNQMRAVWCPLKPLPSPVIHGLNGRRMSWRSSEELGRIQGWNHFYETVTGEALDDPEEVDPSYYDDLNRLLIGEQK